ncbi:hypothetical protein ACFV3R_11995 [Streptomyces sp. NPDC059740]|uniref:hypothetical protein n=1 Tax=Streptomyces sp. NPDC059740 TaxID=3346926 RepID=UPI0036655B2B
MPEQPTHVPEFIIRQKVKLAVNQYRILGVQPDGTEGELFAFAQQKLFKLKEEVVFYTDESRTRPLFSFKARKTLDVHSGVDVLDHEGEPIGYFKKEFARSLLRSTWTLKAEGLETLGQERSPVIAVVRRLWQFLPFVSDIPAPFPFHFDFVDNATGKEVMSSTKKFGLRDRYLITVPDRRLDYRVAAAMGVALDALQSR